MQKQNPYTHPHEEDAKRDAIRATDAMPTVSVGKIGTQTIQPRPAEHTGRDGDDSRGEDATAEAEWILMKEELRDHDFPLPPQAVWHGGEPVAEPNHEAEPEAVRSGGIVGTKKGDRQRYSDVPTVMDQVLVEPLSLPDK